MLTIKTDNKPRHVIYGFELTEKQRKEFDWIDPADIDNETFVLYKGQVYNIGEFTAVGKYNAEMKGWHGYYSDSYFSGVLLRYTADCEYVIMATYYS